MSRKRMTLVATGLFFLLAAVFFLWFAGYFIQPADESGTPQTVIVENGMTLREAAGMLEDKGIIKNKTFFLLWGRLKGYGNRIKSGEYTLSPAMAPVRIFDILIKGAIVTHPVTIPEGYSADQIAETMARDIGIDKSAFLFLVSDPAVLKRYGIEGEGLEGFLYPDTYQFGKGQTPESIINAMILRFNEVISPLKERIAASGMTLKEIVTLASIVEKETGKAEERPMIAGLFLNRLRRGMRLDSDPTVIYGIKDFNGNLTRDDLHRYTAYNTYVINGLPPGPISNPGLESIRAVLYPADSEYLYFVSKNDGSHYFSKTLEEHNRNVGIYQKKGR